MIWAEYFCKFLNRPAPITGAEVQDIDTDLDVSTAPPEKEEIMVTIRSLKNENAALVLHPLFAAIWEEKQLPDDQREGLVVKIPKKGAFINFNKWRGVPVLLSPTRS